jgi:hypothetical protein
MDRHKDENKFPHLYKIKSEVGLAIHVWSSSILARRYRGKWTGAGIAESAHRTRIRRLETEEPFNFHQNPLPD